MKKTSDTDWDRLASMEDHHIDTSDIPELDEAFFEEAQLSAPVRKAHKNPSGCRCSGLTQKVRKAGCQTRTNQLVRRSMEADSRCNAEANTAYATD